MNTKLNPAEQTELAASLKQMNISQIAGVAFKDFKPMNFAAKPYADAMLSLDTVNDDYGLDSGKSIVTYFLGNAQTWRGDVAKAVKKELNSRIKSK